MVVDDAIVKILDLALVDDLNTFLHVQWNEQVTRQPIARSARDDGHCRVGVGQATSYLVDRSVTADGHHDVVAIFSGLPCQLSGMTRMLGLANGVVEPTLVQVLLNPIGYASLADRAGNGINNEKNFLFHTRFYCVAKLIGFLQIWCPSWLFFIF